MSNQQNQMVSLSSKIKEIRERIRVHEHETHEKIVPLTPRPEQECEKCRGQGFLVLNVPPGHPDYRKRLPCNCEKGREYLKRRHQRMFEKSCLPRQQQQFTFESFLAMNELLQEGKWLAFGAAWLFATRKGQPFTLREAALEVGVDHQYENDHPRSWLVLTGPNGYGKTGLAASVINSLISTSTPAMYSRLQDLISSIQNTYRPDAKTTRDQKLAIVQSTPFLVIDECNMAIRDDRISILEEIVRYRDAHGLPTMFTTNWSLKHFQAQWGLQIGDVVATAHWIKVSGKKLRNTTPGEVVSF